LDDFADFTNISIGVAQATMKLGELDKYLCHPVKQVKDPLKWWFHNHVQYPNLHRMALDYLSIPGKYYLNAAVYH